MRWHVKKVYYNNMLKLELKKLNLIMLEVKWDEEKLSFVNRYERNWKLVWNTIRK